MAYPFLAFSSLVIHVLCLLYFSLHLAHVNDNLRKSILYSEIIRREQHQHPVI